MNPRPNPEPSGQSEDLRSRLDQLRALAAHLRVTEDRDRKRLATTLHDTLLQSLVVCRMQLGLLPEQISTPQAAKTLANVKKFLDEAVRYAKTAMSDLHPMLFGDAGDLHDAIAWVVEKMQRQGLIVSVEDTDEQRIVDEDRLILAYQSIHELLTNVLKHARTKTATLRVTRSAERLDISVSDHGKGFDASSLHDPARVSGFGLIGIREHLTLVGGRLELTSDPEKGTCARLLIPLR